MKESEALAPLEALRNRLFGWTLLFVACSAAIALVLTRLLLRPVTGLVHAAESVSRGDLESEVPVDSKDEIGALAEAFNAMVRSVRARTAELQMSETRVVDLLNCAPVGLLLIRKEGAIETGNETAARTFGYPVQELRTVSARRVLPALPADGPMKAVRKNGTEFDAEVVTAPFGEMTVAAVHDITEKLRAERALRDYAALQASLLDAIPYPMFVKDAEARYMGCNHAYEQAFGITRSELRGKTARDLEYLPAEQRERFHAESLTVIREAARRSYETALRFRDGSEHVTIYSLDGFRYDDGRPGGADRTPGGHNRP